MWYRESYDGHSDELGRITTAGSITDYSVIPSGVTAMQINYLAPDSSGDVWFAGYDPSNGTDQVGYVNSSGSPTFYELNSGWVNSNYTIEAIAMGPNGNMWVIYNNEHTYDNNYQNYIQEYNTSGQVGGASYTMPADTLFDGLTTGADGDAWATSIGGAIDELDVPSGEPDSIALVNAYSTVGEDGLEDPVLGSDGNIWFVDFSANSIDSITPGGTITSYSVTSDIGQLTAGPDGALWFTEFQTSANAIGRITTSGSITTYTVPTPDSYPDYITAGPDDALWFGEAGNVGRIGY
jgi:streptogramin lyase